MCPSFRLIRLISICYNMLDNMQCVPPSKAFDGLFQSCLYWFVVYEESLIGELAFDYGDVGFSGINLHLCPSNVFLTLIQRALGTCLCFCCHGGHVVHIQYTITGGRRSPFLICCPSITHFDALIAMVKANGKMLQPAFMTILIWCQVVVLPCGVTQNWRYWK